MTWAIADGVQNWRGLRLGVGQNVVPLQDFNRIGCSLQKMVKLMIIIVHSPQICNICGPHSRYNNAFIQAVAKQKAGSLQTRPFASRLNVSILQA